MTQAQIDIAVSPAKSPNRDWSSFESGLTRPTPGRAEAEVALRGLLAHDPAALKNLDRFINRNDISAGQIDQTLTRIATLADPSAVLHPGMGGRRVEFAAALLSELAMPDSVHQDTKATCTVTEEERNLCRHDPAHYAAIMTDLALCGRAALHGGYQLTLPAAAVVTADQGDKLPARSLSMRIFQSSAMELAARLNGGSYNLLTDTASGAGGDQYRGLYKNQQQILMYALRGQATERLDTYGTRPVSAESMIARIGAAARQEGVPVLINVAGGGVHASHRITVVGIENGTVYFHNPWGAEINSGPARDYHWGDKDNHAKLERMSLSEFKRCLASAFLPVKGGLQITPEPDGETPVYIDQNGVKELEADPARLIREALVQKGSAGSSLSAEPIVKPVTLRSHAASQTPYRENGAAAAAARPIRGKDKESPES